jgi:predicted P-loop ATPase
VIVLVGDQGKGKTVSIQALAPMEETFAEISLHSRDSDLSRLLRGKLIGELAELRGLKSKESEDIKAWISRTTEEWTPKYMEFTKTFKRRLTLWGSTNDRHFLNDVTGNRRWLPISVDNPNPDLIKRDCIQIWAEAIHIFKDYGVLWETVQKLAEDVRAEHFDEDPFVDDVRNYLDANPSMNKVSAREIWVGMGKFGDAFDKRAAGQLKRAMAVLGWTYKKVKTGTKSLQGYVKS